MATMAINDIVTTIGIDLGKNIFHIVGMNACGAIVLKERLSRAKLARRLTNMTSCLIGMEACAGAHHVGRQLAALGHDVRLIPAKVCEAIPERTQERLPRCRGNRGSRAAPDHAVRRRKKY